MVTSVPWQLASSDRAARRPERAQPGAARRGLDDRAFTAADSDLPPAPGATRPTAGTPSPAAGHDGDRPEARAGADPTT